MSRLQERIAGAPITWGVCEVPGWGYQLPPERVLQEMSEIGLRATELGPDGYLPTDAPGLRDTLARHHLRLVAGFVPLVLHRGDRLSDELAQAGRAVNLLGALGCRVLVLSAASDETGYEGKVVLDGDAWNNLVEGIDRVVSLAGEHGLSVALHPHFGTVIEGPDDVNRLLETSTVSLCIDTGHLLIGGADPVAVVRAARERVVHVHLKDIDGVLAERVRAGSLGYHEAVRGGLYRPLGAGVVDVASIVATLEGRGYRGWYVLEQDAVLEATAGRRPGPSEDARASLAFLGRIAARIESGISA
ncbi:MAG: TIM barrel protein [Actinomycetota bacterium]